MTKKSVGNGITEDDPLPTDQRGENKTMSRSEPNTNTTKVTRKPRRSQAKTLDNLIAQIRTDVQSYASALSGVTRDTDRLAPLTAAAYVQFQASFPEGTKLEFMRYFATEDQLKAWPETDAQAKIPGGPVQALFNSIEYLLRRATQIHREHEHQMEVARVRDEAAVVAMGTGKAKGMKGAELESFVNTAKEEATRTLLASHSSAKVSQEEVVTVIEEMWTSDLDDFTVFSKLISRLLSVKYSEKTVSSILAKVTDDLVLQEATVEAKPVVEAPAPPPPVVAPTAETTKVTPAVPFRRRVHQPQHGAVAS